MIYSKKRKNASKKRRSMKSIVKKNPAKKLKRKNAWYNNAEGHRKAAKKGWKRRKATPSKKASRKGVRKNPYKSRRKYRRNPAFGLKKAFTKNWLMQSLEIATGITGGMLGMPIIYAIVPENMKRYRNFFGIIHVMIGAAMFTMLKNKSARTIGGIVAGTGVYDLIASNTQVFLGLQPLPITNSKIPKLSAPIDESSSGVGLSYYGTKEAISADYQAPQQLAADFSSMDPITVGLGDDPFTDISY